MSSSSSSSSSLLDSFGDRSDSSVLIVVEVGAGVKFGSSTLTVEDLED
jgi:hypothetical protein